MTLVMETSDGFVGANGTMEVRALDEAFGGTGAGYQWAHQSGSGWAINTNKAIAGGTGAVQILAVFNATDAADGRVSMQSFKDDAGPVARLNTVSGTKLYLYLRSGGLGYLFYDDGSTYTQIGAGTHTIADGAWLRIVPQGAFISCYVDSTLDIGPVNHTAIATGKPAMWAYEEASSGHGATGFTYETGTLPGGATATQLIIRTQPAGSNQSGVVLATQPVVDIADAGASTVTTDTSTVAVALVTMSGSGTLLGTATKAAVAGSAAFTGLGVTGAGAFKYRFTDGSLASVDSAVFYVGATQLGITSAPTTFISGQAVAIAGTVEDANGATVTSDNATVVTAAVHVTAPDVAEIVSGGSVTVVNGGFALNPVIECNDDAVIYVTVSKSGGGLTPADTATMEGAVQQSATLTLS